MFSVDNFYTILNSWYGPESGGNNILHIFQPHGSRDWKNLLSYFVDKEHQEQNGSYYCLKSPLILHDQEPFDPEFLNIYRANPDEDKKWKGFQTQQEALLMNEFTTMGWPIMCHSEWESNDIAFAESAGVITCHYFYHGLIARDWFRHWKHHGQISLQKNWTHRFLLYARDSSGTRKYRKKLIEDLLPIQNMVNFNWLQEKNITPCYSAKISTDDAQTSAIHLVAETVFDLDKIHLTEKIFKPMVMMQPFILFGGANSLQYLKRYGFRTFGNIWDESYDQETNHQQRYAKIMKLITDLSQMPDDQINHLLTETKHIVEHNHRHFFSELFEKILLDELQTNMQICLSKQDTKVKEFPGGTLLYQFERLRERRVPLPHGRAQVLKDTLNYLKITDTERLSNILHQHPWLSNNGFV